MAGDDLPTPVEYLDAVEGLLRELLRWRDRWDGRTPADEPRLRAEWQRLVDRCEALIAHPVAGER